MTNKRWSKGVKRRDGDRGREGGRWSMVADVGDYRRGKRHRAERRMRGGAKKGDGCAFSTVGGVRSEERKDKKKQQLQLKGVHGIISRKQRRM